VSVDDELAERDVDCKFPTPIPGPGLRGANGAADKYEDVDAAPAPLLHSLFEPLNGDEVEGACCCSLNNDEVELEYEWFA
jgi:hypothetical protein